MFKEELTKKLKELRVNGTTQIVAKLNNQKIEVKLFQINDVEFIAVTCPSFVLKTYPTVNNNRVNNIIKDLETSLKGIELELNNAMFV